MAHLTDLERACVGRYCALLAERLGDRLVEVRMFGSAARGDMWDAHWPMHSDVDLLVVTRGAVEQGAQDELVDATYDFYLECGRQLSPQFMPEARLAAPPDPRTRVFLDRVAADGVAIWPRAGAS